MSKYTDYWCPRCGAKHRFEMDRGFKKRVRSKWRYLCYECGVDVTIKINAIHDVKDLRY